MALDVDWLGKQFGDLTSLSALSSGGQKWVFSADHESDGDVVLKLIKPSISLDLVTREILAVRTIVCDRVPEILQYGDIDTPLGKCLWIREKRIDGVPLSETVANGCLSPQALLTLGLHILEVLAKAEELNIVHRDVKPCNIMADERGGFWLLDFGLARHLDLASLTPSADVFGKCTPGYAPPEQFRNDKPSIDSRSDLFALGVTLIECATGANPFRVGARDTMEVLRRVQSQQLPLLNLQFSSANEFRDLVACMVQKRRNQRPTSASEALTWMKEICEEENIL